MTVIVVDEVTNEWVVSDLDMDEVDAASWHASYWEVEDDCCE
jgi:hypothetical protein